LRAWRFVGKYVAGFLRHIFGHNVFKIFYFGIFMEFWLLAVFVSGWLLRGKFDIVLL
jgi:hypothetical protein